MGLAVWCTDQAGPYQAIPYPGRSWRPEGDPARQPHEYLRDGTAKALTLFHPADGRVRLHGVTACPNAALHPWLKREPAEVLDAMPGPPGEPAAGWRAARERWQEGLTIKPTLPSKPPPLRMLLVLDWTTWPGTRRPSWCAGSSITGSCRCTRRWAGRG